MAVYLRSFPAPSIAGAAAAIAAFAISTSAVPFRCAALVPALGAIVLGLLFGLLSRGMFNTHVAGPELGEGPATVTGAIISDPTVYPDGRARLELRGEWVEYGEYALSTERVISVQSDNRLARFRRGEEVRIAGNLSCADRRTGGVARCRSYTFYAGTDGIERLSPAIGVDAALNQIGAALESAMLRVGNPETGAGRSRERAALMWALMLGDRAFLSERTSEAYRRAGVIHTLALSGMHLSVLAGGAMLVLTRFVGRRRALILSLLIAGLYVLVVGVRPSLLRALVMYGVFVVASLSGYRLLPINALAITFLVVTVGWPGYVYTLSFQLSFLSLFGMFGLGVPLGRQLIRVAPPIAAYALSASITAVVATAPLLLTVFGEIHPIGIAAGPVVGPMVTLFLAFALGHTMVGWLGFDLVTAAMSSLGDALYGTLDAVVFAAAGAPALAGTIAWIGIGALVVVSVGVAWRPAGDRLSKRLGRDAPRTPMSAANQEQA